MNFRVTPDVSTLWDRYRGHVGGREPLLAMGYFYLTVLEGGAGRRANAAAKYRIDGAVLNKLGELTSVRGDPLSARKMTSTKRPLTGSEHQWVLEAIKRLIWRAGDPRNRTELSLITMADLPVYSSRVRNQCPRRRG